MSTDSFDSTPPLLWRLRRPFRAFQACLIAAAAAAIWIPGDILGLYLALLVGLALFAELLITLRLRRLNAQLSAVDYKVCVRCGTAAPGGRSRTTCPHCAAAIDVDAARRAWLGTEALGR